MSYHAIPEFQIRCLIFIDTELKIILNLNLEVEPLLRHPLHQLEEMELKEL